MVKKKIDLYAYPDKAYEEAEISANRFNLIFSWACSILAVVVVIFSLIGIFTVELDIILPVFSVSFVLFLVPTFVYLIHDKIMKCPNSILKWKRFKYTIYVPVYFGLLFIDIMLAYQAVLLIVIPPLMAAQYRYIKRDWYLIFITTIITIPIIVYVGFIFGIPDLNMIKGLLTEEEMKSIPKRAAILATSRSLDLFLHYCLPRIFAIAAIDFLTAVLKKRNTRMIDNQAVSNKQIVEANEKRNKLQTAVIDELASVIETRDVNTGEHVIRTKRYVTIICNRLMKEEKYKNELTPENVRKIISAAPLHDIGKIAVSDTILLKPGRLDKEEYEKMKVHSETGGIMVQNFFDKFEDDSFAQEAYEIAMYHHERWDGKGYPKSLKGEEIPLAARIMAIADVYDALVSKRVYKEPFSAEDSFNILIEEAGKQFDPEIIEILKTIKDEFIEAAK